jgi:hypothetical protein
VGFSKIGVLEDRGDCGQAKVMVFRIGQSEILEGQGVSVELSHGLHVKKVSREILFSPIT